MKWAKQKENQNGFTIVELLIVVVVIAILAAITIVSYNGIQSSANQTTTVQAVNQFAKAASMYAANNGVYPVPGGSGCLPDSSGNNLCSNVGNGAATCFGMGQGAINTSIETALKTMVSNIPAVSDQTGTCGGQNYRGAYFTVAANGKDATMYAFFRGNIPCPSMGGLTPLNRYQQDTVTLCTSKLPTL